MASTPALRVRDDESLPRGGFRDLLNRIDGIVWEADPATFTFNYVSPAAERILGYPVAEWRVPGFWESRVHPEDRERVMAFCASQTRAGRNHEFEYRMLAADGRAVWLRDLVTVSVENGVPVALGGVMIDISDLKRAQQDLADQAQFLRELGEVIGSPLFWKDTEGRYQGCNRAFEDYMGIARRDLIGKTVFDFASEETARIHTRADAELFTHGRMQVYEAAVTCHDGTHRHVAFNKAVYLKGDGSPGGVVGIMLDVTRERAVSDALARESAYLKAVLQHLPQGISVFDENLRLRHWNEGMAEVLNFPPEVLTDGVHFDDLIRIPAQRGEYGPGDPDEHVARFHALAMEFRPHEFERRRQNGEVHLVCGRPMQVGGRLAGFVTTYTDITAHKQVEKKLQLSDTVFNNTAVGITVTDARRRIVKVNPAFSTITGYDECEVIGKTHALLNSGLQDAAFYAAMWREIDSTGSWSGEIWNRRKSGELYAEHLSIKRVLDSAGEVINYIGIFSDISHYKIAQDRIEQLSFFDALTGLPNRALLRDRLQQAVYTAERRHSRVALLLIDLDRLSHVNDSLGHHIGDLLLLRVKARWQPLIRASDTLSRHIGDEFAVILEDIHDAQDAAEMAEKLLAALVQPFNLEGHEVSASACIGISIFPSDGKTPDVLLKNADVALHHAKEAAGGRFQFFREEMNLAATERLLIESSLRQAMARKEFQVFYQPQLELASGRIKGMEALARWRHPELGLVSPAKFIPIAEETGQIIEIGAWVMREACRQAQEWHAAGHAGLVVAVNVSAKQFEHDGFAAQVKQVLRETGLAAPQLELEITESVIMDRPDHVVAVMKELRDIGVRFSIDDFGTGYSSLSQLKRFPIDTLKIDQSFTRDIGLDDGGTAITRAVIALGRSLHLQVVAEGVETREQQHFLSQHGCHGMQGYLFSKPVEAAAFAKLLATHAPPGNPPEWNI